MALFEQKVWTDRQVQFPSRRKLTNVNTQEEKTVIVERNEGIIYEEGNLFDAANINDLEERVAAAFNEIEESLNNRINLYYPVGKIFMAVTDLHLEDPAQQVFPGTTWVRLENRVLLPVDPETEESGVEGGSNTLEVKSTGTAKITGASVAYHKLTEDEMPKHRHAIISYYSTIQDPPAWGEGSMNLRSPNYSSYVGSASSPGHTHGFKLSGDATFNMNLTASYDNMQKYITVFAWRRMS